MKFVTHCFAAILVLSILSTPTPAVAAEAPPAQPNLFGQLPVAFESNTGQTDSRARFVLRGPGYTAFFNEREMVFAFRHNERQPSRYHRRQRTVAQSIVHVTLVASNPKAQLIGVDELPTRANYLIGPDSNQWHTDVPAYSRLAARNVYPGIDVTYYGTARNLEYDFVVQPGGDPTDIRLRFDGSTRANIDTDGHLHISVDGQEVATWHAPVAYQHIDGMRREVTCAFVQTGPHDIGFAPGDYNRAAPLTIDPILLYSTFLGGSGADAVEAITVHSNSLFVVGETTSLNFPAPGGYRTNAYASNDVFIAKFNTNGTSLVFATYLGGSGDDFAMSVRVDASGNVCVAGGTDSPNFPVKNAYQSGLSGIGDAFVTKLASAGNSLLYSTYFGGNGYEAANGLVIGTGGNIYVAGETDSGSQFPKKTPFQNGTGGLLDAFVARFDPTAAGNASLIFASWLGGSDDDRATAINIDGAYIYVVGEVEALDFFSSDFPVKNARQPVYGGGGSDAFVAKISLAGSAVSLASYLGGVYEDEANGVVVDGSGNIHVVGTTSSDDLPMVNAQQPVIGGGGIFFTSDAFIAKLSPNGSNVLYSTYLGGDVDESGAGIGIDPAGSIYIVGWTTSTNFPTSAGAVQSSYNGGAGDLFVAKLNPAVAGHNGIVYSTYFGGRGGEDPGVGNCLFVNTNENFFFGGTTTSNGFPVTNAFASTFRGGDSDGFIARLASQIDLSASVAVLDTVMVGSNFAYTVRVNNNSRSNFTSVQLTNLLATNVNFISATASRGTVTRTNQTVTWSLGTVTNYTGATLTINVQATRPGLITNVARVTAAQPEVNTGNNIDTTVTAVRGIADLILTKTAMPSPAFASNDLAYSILVSNRGPWDATAITITNAVPTNAAFVSATTTRGLTAIDTGLLICTVPRLTNGATALVTLVVSPGVGVITNVGGVTAFEFDPVPTNNFATNITTVDPAAELILSQTSAPEPVFVGSNVIYSLVVSNYGPFTATTVVISNTLPTNVTFVSASISSGSFTQSNRVVKGTISSLTNRGAVSLIITARATNTGITTNIASVTSATLDPALSNNVALRQTTVNPLPDVSVSASAPGWVYVSQPYALTLRATNTGPLVATNATVTLTVPASATLLSATCSQGQLTTNASTVTCALGSWAPSGSVVITASVRSVAPATNTATTSISSSTYDSNPANNTSTVTTIVNALPRLTVREVASNVALISWTATATNFLPEYTSNWLYTATNWYAVTNPIINTNGVKRFTNGPVSTPKIFRLRQP
jgi:uncharacterized repeat protein (TIGR01451 family)